MKRRDFILKGCSSCLSIAVVSNLISSCNATRYTTGRITENGLLVNKSAFSTKKSGGVNFRSFIIVRNETLLYPVCLFRFSDTQYSAVLMQCTHQGSELQASGDYLQCPAHGSEFNNRGEVKSGPADKNLRSFPVTVSNNEVFIDLRKHS